MMAPRRTWWRWSSYAAFWTMIAALFTALSALVYALMSGYGHGRAGGPPPVAEWAATLATMLADWYLWALLAPLVLWLGSRFSIARDRWRRVVVLHLVFAVAIAFAKVTLRYWIGQAVSWLPTPGWPTILDTLPLNVLVYWSILGVGYALEYHSRFREREIRAAHLESRLAHAQLDVLRMQLHPHFLFNTLHTISVLVREHDNDVADRMIARLSELLRLSIDLEATQEVTLSRELEILGCYLDIQQMRFQERLQVGLDIDPAARDGMLPTLVLQPLVENAIRHGISQRESGGRIDIVARRVENELRLTISDDGPGISTNSNGGSSGVGLANTRARLDNLYGDRHLFELKNGPRGGVTVMLNVPWRDSVSRS
ncbi:MAG: histidine kinase [Gemmatimonadota bacterium]|nr:histidine kinase [Gemmatimonadota bacterium]